MMKVWIRGWVAWCGVLAVALFVLVAFHSGARPAGATHLCGNTGSSQGSFDLQAYEDGNWRTTYSRTLVLAGLDRLFADVPGFDLPQLETGGRSAGSGQLTNPYIPPILLKAIAWIESSWAQADYSVPYGAVGPALISHDCGYGMMQVTSGMQNTSGAPNLEQAMIGGHYAFNIARGARILAEKWNAAPTYRPIVGNRDRTIVENWYYAVWSYHGFSFKNHPLNPGFSLPRSVYRCDGTQPRSNYPYQELIFGCMANPPVVGGAALWNPVAVTLPNLSQPAFSLNSWNSCSVSRDCAAMDLATPNPFHTDPANTSLSRIQVIGWPTLSVSPSQASLVAVPPAQPGSASVVIAKTGSGALAWRASTSASWLKVSRSQGVSIVSQPATITLSAQSEALPPGKYTATLTIESLWAAGAPATVAVTLHNYADGSLVQASGTGVYVMRGGLKRGIRNPVTFEANGFKWVNINQLPGTVLASIPSIDPLLDAMADGNLLTASGFGAYVMDGGSRRLIRNTTVFSECGYGWDAVRGISGSRLSGIPRGPDLTGLPCPKLLPPSGTLVQARGTAIYVMKAVVKRGIRNPVSFEANGFQWGNVNQLARSTMAAIPSGQPLLDAMADGNLLTASGFGAYVMEGGARRLVKNTVVFSECGYDWELLQSIPASRFTGIARGPDLTGPPCPRLVPPNGTLLQAPGSAIYVMGAGLKREIPNPVSYEANGFKGDDVNLFPASLLATIPTGQILLDALDDGNLLTASGFGAYVMDGGFRRLVKNTSVFSECGYGWDAVRGISGSRLSGIPRGPDLTAPPCLGLSPPNGSLLQGNTADVYVMEAGAKRHIQDADVFTACGYLSGNVNVIAESALKGVPDGPALTATPCP